MNALWPRPRPPPHRVRDIWHDDGNDYVVLCDCGNLLVAHWTNMLANHHLHQKEATSAFWADHLAQKKKRNHDRRNSANDP